MLVFFLSFLIFCLIGYLFVLKIGFIRKSVIYGQQESLIKEFQNKIGEVTLEKEKLKTENIKLQADSEAQKKYVEQKIQDLNNQKEELKTQFKNISNETIQIQNQQFSKEQEKNISLLLSPFKLQLSEFKTKLEEVYTGNITTKTSLEEQLKNIIFLNQTMAQEANNLTRALKGNKKIQGNWGEFQLENILEFSGLQKGISYTTQDTFLTEDKKLLRPDVKIILPNQRKIFIDSKVSLVDYVDSVTLDTQEEKDKSLKKHVQCIRNHIDCLASKEYQNLLKDKAINEVILFIPIESAYVEAVTYDRTLLDYAYKKHIILTSVSSLMATLKVVEHLWQVSNQNKNVLEIAEIGGRLVDKIVSFKEDMNALETALDSAKSKYEKVKLKMIDGKGSALFLAKKMQNLGAKSTKQIDVFFEEEKTPLLENKSF